MSEFDRWVAARVELFGLDLDLEVLRTTNHRGNNNRAIDALTRRREQLCVILGRPVTGSPLPDFTAPLLLRLSYFDKVVTVVLEPEMVSRTVARWIAMHGGGGAVSRRYNKGELG